jgi:hypothetical protein
MLELGGQPAGQTQRSATLFKRERGRVTLPVAFGFCEDRAIDATAAAPSSDPAAIGTDNPAFDPARWPEEDCGLIVSNGRRIRFRFTLTGETQLRLDSPDLWSGRPVSTTIRWQNSGDSTQIGAFGGNGGPEGAQMMFVETPTAVKLIRFRELGDPSIPNATGYGICSYRGLVRRPYLQ